LQRDGCAQGNAAREEMMHFFARVKRVRDGHRVPAFFPAVRGHVAAALSLRAQIHHHEAVAVAEQEFRMADNSGAVVADAVEEQNPIARR
jgi:hypothetical protein